MCVRARISLSLSLSVGVYVCVCVVHVCCAFYPPVVLCILPANCVLLRVLAKPQQGCVEVQGCAGQVALGFTYEASKVDGRWRASTIKGGWAQQSGMIKSGDVIVSVEATQCAGLDLKALTSLLQVSELSSMS